MKAEIIVYKNIHILSLFSLMCLKVSFGGVPSNGDRVLKGDNGYGLLQIGPSSAAPLERDGCRVMGIAVNGRMLFFVAVLCLS